jgi:hypothetical protein
MKTPCRFYFLCRIRIGLRFFHNIHPYLSTTPLARICDGWDASYTSLTNPTLQRPNNGGIAKLAKAREQNILCPMEQLARKPQKTV